MDRTANLDGHLGEGTEIKGTLRFDGSVRIDGKFNGKILSPATLIVGPKGSVDGEVEVGELAAHGSVRGKIKAANKVTIHATGKVEAEVKTTKFVVEQGAFYRGQCDMQRQAPPSPKPASAPNPATPGASAGAAPGGGGPAGPAPRTSGPASTAQKTPEKGA